jgi:small subunit ribosomal protein S16
MNRLKQEEIYFWVYFLVAVNKSSLVKIRLRRTGARNQACYRIVAVDSRRKRDGIYLENLGHYNPRREPAEIVVKKDNIIEWLKKGAQISDGANHVLRRAGILKAWHEYKVECQKQKKLDKLEKAKTTQENINIVENQEA